MAMAVGQMGLSRDDYLDSTPFEFERIYVRWMERIEKDRENELNQKLFVARLQIFKMLCPPKGKKIRITDIFELPGEKEVLSAERRKRKSTEPRFRTLADKWSN
jgi:uncharacterized protein YktA (UPF0223 family)